MKFHARKAFAHGIEERVEQKGDLLAVLFHELGTRRGSVREHKGIVAFLFEVFFVVVERVDEIDPFPDGVEEFLRRGSRCLLHEMRAQILHERGRGFRRLVGRGRTLFFHRRLFADKRLDPGHQRGILFLGALVALFEPRAFDSSAAAVRDVVGELVIGEYRIECAQLHGERIHGRNGPLADGMLEAILPLDADIRPRHVMQERGEKGHIIGETQPRALPARRADGLAQAAIERLVEHEVLNTQVGQIVANISEHALFSPIKSHFAVHFGKRLARRAEGIFLAAL